MAKGLLVFACRPLVSKRHTMAVNIPVKEQACRTCWDYQHKLVCCAGINASVCACLCVCACVIICLSEIRCIVLNMEKSLR